MQAHTYMNSKTLAPLGLADCNLSLSLSLSLALDEGETATVWDCGEEVTCEDAVKCCTCILNRMKAQGGLRNILYCQIPTWQIHNCVNVLIEKFGKFWEMERRNRVKEKWKIRKLISLKLFMKAYVLVDKLNWYGCFLTEIFRRIFMQGRKRAGMMIFTFSSHTVYVKRKSILIAWLKKNSFLLINVHILDVWELKTSEKSVRLSVRKF